MVRAWRGRGMASVNQTRPHCVNQMGKTQCKPLVTRHGHGMLCESCLTVLLPRLRFTDVLPEANGLFCNMMNGCLMKESLVCFIEGLGQLCASNGPDSLHDT
jgi:hypothetical protein